MPSFRPTLFLTLALGGFLATLTGAGTAYAHDASMHTDTESAATQEQTDQDEHAMHHDHGAMQSSDEHAAHDMSGHAGHDMGGHEGHDMSGHEGHDMGGHEGHDMSGHAGHEDHSAHMAMIKGQHGYTVKSALYTLPTVKLVDMHKQETSVPELFAADQPLLVNFIFTTCTTICPIMSATFAQAQELLGADVAKLRMISISIDPEQDTPDALTAYAAKFKAGKQWDFYTGKLEDVNTTLKAFDAFRGNKMNHVPLTLIRKDRNSPWVRLEGLTSAKDLVAEYRKVMGGEQISKQ